MLFSWAWLLAVAVPLIKNQTLFIVLKQSFLYSKFTSV